MKSIYLLLLVMGIGAIAVGCENRDYSKQISDLDAEKIAIAAAYENNEYYMNISKVNDVILDVEKQNNGDYIIQVCDLNIECKCREYEGYWVKIKYDGSTSEIIRTNLCPYG
jgi:hypothetical protein